MLQDWFEQLQLFNMQILTGTDIFTIFISLFMLVFAKKLIYKTDSSGNIIENYDKRILILRTCNTFLLISYIISILINITIGEAWIQSYLTILFTFLSIHFVNHWILEKYGDHEIVDDVTRFTDNPASKNFRFGISFSIVFISIMLLLMFWDLEYLYKNGSIFAIIGVILFATKEYWLEESGASFTITSDGRFKRGNIISFKSEEEDNYYVILETKLMGTRLKNLKTEVEVDTPNSKFIRSDVELYSIEDLAKAKKDEALNGKKAKREFKAFKQFLHFNIGYSTDHDTITHYFEKVIEESQKKCSAVGKNYVVNLHNNADHAVTWELIYYVQNPFQILNAKNAINLAAFKLQNSCNVDLSTPITHKKIEDKY